LEKDFSKNISIINVMNKLKLDKIYELGDVIYIKCPFCYSKNADMKLNINNNSYVCKNCEEKGYSIGLYAKLKFITTKEAFKELISEKPEIDFKVNKILQNDRKSDNELHFVYSEFLKKLKLERKHFEKLISYGFSEEYIIKNKFKSVPNDESIKIKICEQLIKEGCRLQGITGFYQNSNFKWTFKSHEGIFIPVINNTILGLRINLDKEYNTNTSDIWFSSSNCYNGTKARNDIMVLKPKDNILELVNQKNKKDVIVTTEMILAHKLASKYRDTIVIGIPNVISKQKVESLRKLININNIFFIMDFHTMMTSPVSALEHFYNYYDKSKILICFSMKECEIPKKIHERFDKKVNAIFA